MMFNRSQMKSCARENIAGLQPYFLAPGLLYTALTYLLSLLLSQLSGYSQYVLDQTKMAQEVVLNNVEPYIVEWITPPPAAIVLCFCLLCMSMILKVGLMWYCLQLSRQIPMKARRLFDSFFCFTRVVCLEIVKTVLCTAACLLFVFPALLLVYRYCFAEYILNDHPEYGVFKCLHESAKMTKGRRWELFLLDLSMLGWYFLQLCLTIATAYVTPYEYAVKCEYYNRISGWRPAENGSTTSEEKESQQ